jgi:hypothetical protein
LLKSWRFYSLLRSFNEKTRHHAALYFPTANGKDSSEVGKMGMFENMKKPRAGELQGA